MILCYKNITCAEQRRPKKNREEQRRTRIKHTMFSAEYFTCVLEELQKKHNIVLESEIVEYIFDDYNYENLMRQKYEKYNLFELMILLDKTELKSALNKTAIIDAFIANKLEIDYYNSEEMLQEHNIKWKTQKLRRSDYNIVIGDNNGKYIHDIHIDDIIKIGDKEYSIYMSLYKYLYICEEDEGDDMCVILKDVETEEETEYEGQEFINLFERPDITYVKSLRLDWIHS